MDLKQYVDYEGNYHLDDEYTYNEYEFYNDDDQDASVISNHKQLLPEMINFRLSHHNIADELQFLCVNCIGVTLWQSIEHIAFTLCVCFALRMILLVMQTFFLKHVKIIAGFHVVVILSGIAVLRNTFTDAFSTMLLVLSSLLLFVYLLNWFCACKQLNGGLIAALGTVVFIILGEIYFSDPLVWNKLRGVLLLVSMKLISLSFDMFSCQIKDTYCNIFEFFSYCLHPGFLVYGPWISVKDYRNYIYSKRLLSIDWLFCIIKNIFLSFLCLVLSVCILPYLFIDPVQPQNPSIFPIKGSKWLMSYCTAISFHFSHYYISYLAVVTSTLSGVGGVVQKKLKTEDDVESSSNVSWSEFKVTRPISVEIPRSMLNVVVAWNIPMSKWLKIYVFDKSRVLGDFPAVIFTYVASAMLHGLSLHLAAVLISLAFYTYTEHKLRLKLSNIFNCPEIQARPPKTENNNFRGQRPLSPWARLFNYVWVIINLMHLAYLGSMFHSSNESSEGYSITYTISEWRNLNFFSHWFALACFVVSLLI